MVKFPTASTVSQLYVHTQINQLDVLALTVCVLLASCCVCRCDIIKGKIEHLVCFLQCASQVVISTKLYFKLLDGVFLPYESSPSNFHLFTREFPVATYVVFFQQDTHHSIPL